MEYVSRQQAKVFFFSRKVHESENDACRCLKGFSNKIKENTVKHLHNVFSVTDVSIIRLVNFQHDKVFHFKY